VSEELADEIAEYCANNGLNVPELLEGFLDRYRSGRLVAAAAPGRGLATSYQVGARCQPHGPNTIRGSRHAKAPQTLDG
jgi:hypothetical protein